MRACLFAALLFTTTSALAAEEGHRFVAGAKLVELTSISHGHASAHWGGGAFFEIAVVPHLVEIELSVAFLEAHGVMVPIDLVAKYPYYFSDELVGFVGAGPVINIVAESADPDHGEEAPGVDTFFGFATVVGAYYWFMPTLGALAQLSYNGVWEHQEYVSEVGGAVGVAYRF